MKVLAILLTILCASFATASLAQSVDAPERLELPLLSEESEVLLAQVRRSPAPSTLQRLRVNRGDPAAGLPAPQQRLMATIRPGEEYDCNGSCLCKGAKDCVDMSFSGCCGGAITCNDTACSCVNQGGC